MWESMSGVSDAPLTLIRSRNRVRDKAIVSIVVYITTLVYVRCNLHKALQLSPDLGMEAYSVV